MDQTDRQTDRTIWRLYDRPSPEGRVGANIIETLKTLRVFYMVFFLLKRSTNMKSCKKMVSWECSSLGIP